MTDEFCALCAGEEESPTPLDLKETAFGMICRECRVLLWGEERDGQES